MLQWQTLALVVRLLLEICEFFLSAVELSDFSDQLLAGFAFTQRTGQTLIVPSHETSFMKRMLAARCTDDSVRESVCFVADCAVIFFFVRLQVWVWRKAHGAKSSKDDSFFIGERHGFQELLPPHEKGLEFEVQHEATVICCFKLDEEGQLEVSENVLDVQERRSVVEVELKDKGIRPIVIGNQLLVQCVVKELGVSYLLFW